MKEKKDVIRFSVIIPTYNRCKLLERCIKSLEKQNIPSKDFEIIVADDESDDKTVSIIMKMKKTIKNLRLVKCKHGGQGAARNKGIKVAKGDIIAFTDDDCIVPDNWLKNIEKKMIESGTDIVGGSIMNPTEGYIAETQYILNFSSWFPEGDDRFVRDIPTANIAYKKTAINNKRFPEHLGHWGYEDTIYNYRFIEEGKKILFCPSISIIHHTWDKDYGLKKFFYIQKKAAIGFTRGYYVHGIAGKILIAVKPLNLLCPRLFLILGRCIKARKTLSFIKHFPLLLVGELFAAMTILKEKRKTPSPLSDS